jgi:hypothetical protein
MSDFIDSSLEERLIRTNIAPKGEFARKIKAGLGVKNIIESYAVVLDQYAQKSNSENEEALMTVLWFIHNNLDSIPKNTIEQIDRWHTKLSKSGYINRIAGPVHREKVSFYGFYLVCAGIARKIGNSNTELLYIDKILRNGANATALQYPVGLGQNFDEQNMIVLVALSRYLTLTVEIPNSERQSILEYFEKLNYASIAFPNFLRIIKTDDYLTRAQHLFDTNKRKDLIEKAQQLAGGIGERTIEEKNKGMTINLDQIRLQAQISKAQEKFSEALSLYKKYESNAQKYLKEVFPKADKSRIPEAKNRVQDALLNLAQISMELNDMNEFRRYLNELDTYDYLSNVDTHDYYRFLKGQYFVRQDPADFSAAIAQFEKIKNPFNHDFSLALTYFQKGVKADSLEQLGKASTLFESLLKSEFQKIKNRQVHYLPSDKDLNVVVRLYIETMAATENIEKKSRGLAEVLDAFSKENSRAWLGFDVDLIRKDLSPLTMAFLDFFKLKTQSRDLMAQLGKVVSKSESTQSTEKALALNLKAQKALEGALNGQINSENVDSKEIKGLIFRVQTSQIETQIETLSLFASRMQPAETEKQVSEQANESVAQVTLLENAIKALEQSSLLPDQRKALDSLKLSLALKSMELLSSIKTPAADAKLVAVMNAFKSEYLVVNADKSLGFKSDKAKILAEYFPLSLWSQKLFQTYLGMEDAVSDPVKYAAETLAYARFLENTFKVQIDVAQRDLLKITKIQNPDAFEKVQLRLAFAVQAQCFWLEYNNQFLEAAKLFESQFVLNKDMREFVLGRKLLTTQTLSESELYMLVADKYKWSAVSRKILNRRGAYDKSLQYHNLATSKTVDADEKANVQASLLQMQALYWLGAISPNATISDETKEIEKALMGLQPKILASLQNIKSYKWGEQLLSTYVYVTASLRHDEEKNLNDIQAAVNDFIDQKYPCTRGYKISPDQLLKLQLLSASAIRDNYAATPAQIALAIKQYEQIKPILSAAKDIRDVEISIIELKSRSNHSPAHIAAAQLSLTQELLKTDLPPGIRARLLLAQNNVYLAKRNYEALAQNQILILAHQFGLNVSDAQAIGLKNVKSYAPDGKLGEELEVRVGRVKMLEYCRSTIWGLFMGDVRKNDLAGHAQAEGRQKTIHEMLKLSEKSLSGDNSKTALKSRMENERYLALLEIYKELNQKNTDLPGIVKQAQGAVKRFGDKNIQKQFMQDFVVMLEVFKQNDVIAELAASWYGKSFEKTSVDLTSETKLICLKALKELSREDPKFRKSKFDKEIELLVIEESQKLAGSLSEDDLPVSIKQYLLEEISFLDLEHFLNLKQRDDAGVKVNAKVLSLAKQRAEKAIDLLRSQALASDNQLRFYLDRIYFYQMQGRFDLAQSVLNDIEKEKLQKDSGLNQTLNAMDMDKHALLDANIEILQANNYLWNGDHRIAQHLFETMLNKTDVHPSVYRSAQMGLGQALLYQGYKDRSLAVLEKLKDLPTLGGDFRDFDKSFNENRDKSLQDARSNTLQVQIKAGTQNTSNRSYSTFYFPRSVYHPGANVSDLKLGAGQSELQQTTERRFVDISVGYELTHAIKVEAGFRPQSIDRVNSQYQNVTNYENYTALGQGYPETGQSGLQFGKPVFVGNSRSYANTFDARGGISYLSTFRSQALEDIRFLSNQVMLSGSFGQEEFFNRPDLGLAVDALNATNADGSVRFAQAPAKSVPRYLNRSQMSLRDELTMSVYRQKLIAMLELGSQSQEILLRNMVNDQTGQTYMDTQAVNKLYPYAKAGVTMDLQKLFSILTVSPSVAISKTVPTDHLQPRQNTMVVPGIKVELDLPWIKNWLNLDRLYLRGSYQRSTGNQFDGFSSHQENSRLELGGNLGNHNFGIGVANQNIPYETRTQFNTSHGVLNDKQVYGFWQGLFDFFGGDKKKEEAPKEEKP